MKTVFWSWKHTLTTLTTSRSSWFLSSYKTTAATKTNLSFHSRRLSCLSWSTPA
jgi:hypothetical protein